MNLESNVKTRILSVVNIFETGTAEGKYDAISVYADGKRDANGKKTRQVTYGRSQTTEQGNLKDLIADYIKNGGKFAQGLSYYLTKIGVEPLADNAMFKEVLTDAAQQDPIMRSTQDAFFDKEYLVPALTFCETNGFTLPLSTLVIYDSHIHSGRIRDDIRNMFPESTPKKGGSEKAWIIAYVEARRKWLQKLPDPVPQTIYRMDCFRAQIAANNWMLDKPVMSNGALSKGAFDLSDAAAQEWEGYEMKDKPLETTAKILKLMNKKI
jgi:chitosanase